MLVISNLLGGNDGTKKHGDSNCYVWENIWKYPILCLGSSIPSSIPGSTFFVFSNWLPDQQKNPWNLLCLGGNPSFAQRYPLHMGTIYMYLSLVRYHSCLDPPRPQLLYRLAQDLVQSWLWIFHSRALRHWPRKIRFCWLFTFGMEESARQKSQRKSSEFSLMKRV
jgi:hypothetical protein